MKQKRFLFVAALLVGTNAAAQTVPVSPATEIGRGGAVVVLREGKPLGLGALLAGDGRVLTSYSALSGKETAEVRYPDGSMATSRIGTKDAQLDLALLVPVGKRRLDGFKASELDAKRQRLDVYVQRARVEPTGLALTGDAEVHKATGERLPAVYDVSLVPATPPGGWIDPKAPPPPPPATLLPGAPIVDPAGDLIGMVVRLCRVDAPAHCTPTYVAAGVPLLRSFLASVSQTPPTPPAWIGLAGESDLVGGTRGVRIVAVAPAGPAQRAGLKVVADRKKSQMVLSVDGVPVDSPEALSKELAGHAPGDVVKLSIREGDRIREVAVTLAPAPEPTR